MAADFTGSGAGCVIVVLTGLLRRRERQRRRERKRGRIKKKYLKKKIK